MTIHLTFAWKNIVARRALEKLNWGESSRESTKFHFYHLETLGCVYLGAHFSRLVILSISAFLVFMSLPPIKSFLIISLLPCHAVTNVHFPFLPLQHSVAVDTGGERRDHRHP